MFSKSAYRTGIPLALAAVVGLLTVASAQKGTQEQAPAKRAKPAKSPEAKSATEKSAPVKEAATPPKKGMVWVNTDSKIFHAAGSRWYGKTIEGKWMTEAEAVKAGYRAAK